MRIGALGHIGAFGTMGHWASSSRALRSSSASDHSPGTTISGTTQPSSALTGLVRLGAALGSALRAPTSPWPPHRMASCVLSLPVIAKTSTSSWCARCVPVATLPETSSTKPASMSGRSARRRLGSRKSLTALSLHT